MQRVDQALVERGLCESREKAKRAVMAGQVLINGQPARKPSDGLRPGDVVSLTAAEKYVSRGGFKLEHALTDFQLDVAGLVALDLGASTGGFTDCLLQAGAKRVFAVDVGQGQLAWKLRQDPRVVVMEKTNARDLTSECLIRQIRPKAAPFALQKAERPRARVGGDALTIDVVTIDCSFISLRKILPPAVALLRPGGRIVALIKPQFESGKAEADRGAGVIRDPAIHERVLQELAGFVGAMSGLVWRCVTESPLRGPAGNKEFLVLIEKLG